MRTVFVRDCVPPPHDKEQGVHSVEVTSQSFGSHGSHGRVREVGLQTPPNSWARRIERELYWLRMALVHGWSECRLLSPLPSARMPQEHDLQVLHADHVDRMQSVEQGSKLHIWYLVSKLGHALPPWRAGRCTRRWQVRSPPPQSFEQGLQLVHAVTMQSSAHGMLSEPLLVPVQP